MQVQSLASLSGLRIRRCPELWRRPAAVAPIRPLAWEPLYAAGAALQRQIIIIIVISVFPGPGCKRAGVPNMQSSPGLRNLPGLPRDCPWKSQPPRPAHRAHLDGASSPATSPPLPAPLTLQFYHLRFHLGSCSPTTAACPRCHVIPVP